jgi:ABC-2 type transport system ATP-binding protein
MAAVIEVEELRKRYGGLTAVDGVSFRVAEREVFGIVGPNGAGKTTTVEIVEGLRRPDGGRVRVLGLDPGRDGPGLRQRIGAQLQKAACPTGSRSGRPWTCTPPSTTGRSCWPWSGGPRSCSWTS